MRIVVIGAGVIGSVYAGRLAAAGHDVSLLARGSRKATLERDGVILHTADTHVVAFLQHVGDHADRVRSRVGEERTVLAFPGIGGRINADGSIVYVEIAAQPTTIDKTAAHAEAFRTVVASAGMRTALEADMPAWFATHTVFIACLGAGILACGGDAEVLAGNRAQLRAVTQAIREGFAALGAAGSTVTPTALRVLFLYMPRWFGAAYWRRALRGPVGTIAIAPHIRASQDDEFPTICSTVLDQLGNSGTTPALVDLLTPWAGHSY